jgi:methionyl-tRNA formyltransferase
MKQQVHVVVLTHPSPRGVAVLDALARKHTAVQAVILDTGRGGVRDLGKKVARGILADGWVKTAQRVGRKLWRAAVRRHTPERTVRFYRQYSDTVEEVVDANDARSEQLLRSLDPHLLVLGATRILKPHILDIPKLGVLNPHPGLLPAYRGVDVIPWALHNGDPLGVTVHFVDATIDTGPIVDQRSLDVRPGDTIASLHQRADESLGELMAEIVSQIATGGQVERCTQDQRHRLYTSMPPELVEGVERNLRTLGSTGR